MYFHMMFSLCVYCEIVGWIFSEIVPFHICSLGSYYSWCCGVNVFTCPASLVPVMPQQKTNCQALIVPQYWVNILHNESVCASVFSRIPINMQINSILKQEWYKKNKGRKGNVAEQNKSMKLEETNQKLLTHFFVCEVNKYIMVVEKVWIIS